MQLSLIKGIHFLLFDLIAGIGQFNNMIQRAIDIENNLEKNKVLIIYGSRQVGKTTSVEKFLSETSFKHVSYSGDNLEFAHDLAKCDLEHIKRVVGDNHLLFIDEAQKIQNIGTALKLIVDHIPDIRVIATGSSSFDLANTAEEPLTGRKNLLVLYPVAVSELLRDHTLYEFEKRLGQYLIYGMYPEVVTYESYEQKEKRIIEIKDSALIKDILAFQKVKKSRPVIDLLKLLAFQIGSEVSCPELGAKLGLDQKTVRRYLDLLEKSFVLFRLDGFSRNLRKEVSKMSKYYFYDLGIRNALVSNFNDLGTRNDVGQLWENFMVLERIKRNAYAGVSSNYYFWRTYDQKEVDFIEERGGGLYGYEFKWRDNKKKPPGDWLKTYSNATYDVVTPNQYLDFVT